MKESETFSPSVALAPIENAQPFNNGLKKFKSRRSKMTYLMYSFSSFNKYLLNTITGHGATITE